MKFYGAMKPSNALPWPKATPEEVRLWQLKQRTRKASRGALVPAALCLCLWVALCVAALANAL
jgi:hypothetical protein